MLDDEQLVRPLEELVDRRAHRLFDDLYEILAHHSHLGAEEERPPAALVVGRERNELEDPLDVARVEASFVEAVGRPIAHEPLRAWAGVDPGGHDSDRAAVRPGEAAARPISVTSSCVRRPVAGVRRSSG